MKHIIKKILLEETIAATSRKTRSQWSPEATQDLKAFHPDLFELEEDDKDPCWDKYEMIGMKKKGGKEVPNCVPIEEEMLQEAEYQGRKVKLNKPTRGDVKKFKVYVKNDKGNVVKVNFGHGGTSAKKKGEKTMRIRKSNPKARKAFRARHNCSNPGPKWKARYWSCKKW